MEENLEAEEDWILVKKGEEETLRRICKTTFTIIQNNPSKMKYERLLTCKEHNCKMQAKIISHIDEEAELLLKNDKHISTCKYASKFSLDENSSHEESLFEDELFLTLIDTGAAPKKVIELYNKKKNKKISDSKRLRQKISAFKCKRKQSEPNSYFNSIENLEHLRSFISQNTPSLQRFSALDKNSVFLSDFSQINEDTNDFVIIFTTKNLLSNFYNQAQTGFKVILFFF